MAASSPSEYEKPPMGSAGDASQISCSRPDGAVSVLMSATGAVHMRFSRGCADGDRDALASWRLGCRCRMFVLAVGTMDVGLGVGCVRMIRMAMFMTVPMPM